MPIVYKLYSITKPDLIYIGSTGLNLQVRLAQHILSWDSFKRGLNTKRISSYEIIDSGEYGIEEIESCLLEEKFIREQHYIDTIKCVNKNSAYSEFNQKSKESWKIYQKKYYHANPLPHQLRKLSYYYRNKETIKNKRQIKKRFEELPFYV
jgi:hypothetical protein